MMTYFCAEPRGDRLVLTGALTADRAVELIAEHRRAIAVEAPDRADALRIARQRLECIGSVGGWHELEKNDEDGVPYDYCAHCRLYRHEINEINEGNDH